MVEDKIAVRKIKKNEILFELSSPFTIFDL